MIEPNKAGSDTTVGFQGGHAQWKRAEDTQQLRSHALCESLCLTAQASGCLSSAGISSRHGLWHHQYSYSVYNWLYIDTLVQESWYECPSLAINMFNVFYFYISLTFPNYFFHWFRENLSTFCHVFFSYYQWRNEANCLIDGRGEDVHSFFDAALRNSTG